MKARAYRPTSWNAFSKNSTASAARTGAGLALAWDWRSVGGSSRQCMAASVPATAQTARVPCSSCGCRCSPRRISRRKRWNEVTTGSGLPRILVVDDEPAILRFLRAGLGSQGYVVVEAMTGQAALDAVRQGRADLMVLDLGLPDIDGLDVIRRIRGAGTMLPIIVLSSRENEAAKVTALDLGADDYVTKPFGIEELLARLRAAQRHRLQQQGEKPVFRTGDLTVDLVRRIVTVRGQVVKFSPREYALLRLLVQHAGKVLTHRMILKEVWGTETDVQYLRIYIRALRQKIEADPERPVHILTETGVGYRLRVNE